MMHCIFLQKSFIAISVNTYYGIWCKCICMSLVCLSMPKKTCAEKKYCGIFVLWTLQMLLNIWSAAQKLEGNKIKNKVGCGMDRINSKAACPKNFNYTSNFAHYYLTWSKRKKIIVFDLLVIVFFFEFYFRFKWTHRITIGIQYKRGLECCENYKHSPSPHASFVLLVERERIEKIKRERERVCFFFHN